MTTNRYHKAAKDGLLEALRETTKRDCNIRDEQGMTPTLYAAFYGNLDALRLLCGRGGNPDKADLFGNTALHLAAAQGHKHIVTFLINFGANIYAMDIYGRTAQELAGINNRDDILKFIDGVHAKLEATDKKKARALQEKAKKDAKKMIQKFNENVKKREHKVKLERKKDHTHTTSLIDTLKSRITGTSLTTTTQEPQDVRRNTFSAIISGGTMTSGKSSMTSTQRKIRANKNRLGNNDEDFKVSGIEDGKVTISSLKGIRRNSEVLLGGTLEGSNFKERGRLDGVFNEADYVNSSPPPPSGGLIRSKSQPDFLQAMKNNSDSAFQQEPPSIFIRPGMGSIVFRKSVSNNTFSRFNGNHEGSSIGSGESYGPRQMTDDELTDSDSSEDDDDPHGPLERFLTAFDVRDYLPKFIEQDIDLNTLLLLNEDDLKALNLPVGAHRRLVTAIGERKAALENPGEVKDSML